MDEEHFNINRVTRRRKAERASVLYGRSTLTEHEIGQCSRCATVKTVVSRAVDGQTVGRLIRSVSLYTRQAASYALQ